MITEIKEEITEIKTRYPITERIIACAYKVHSELGPGFVEKIYLNALKFALTEIGLRCQTQKKYKVIYQDNEVGILRIDLIIGDSIIVEVKAVNGKIPNVFEQQVLSYLKVTNCNVGLLINFGNKSCQVGRLMFESP